MGSVYCLYSTRNGRPLYIGQTIRAVRDRLRQHELTARDGMADQPVHRWMRKEWLAGHDIEIYEIEYGIEEERLVSREKGWMRNFEGLLNVKEKFYHSFREQPAGKQIRKLCEKEAAKQIDNCNGYHGVSYYHAEDAYQVTVRWGLEDVFCRRIYVLGDSLPGTNSHRYWFTDLNRAIEARDEMREKLGTGRDLWGVPNFQWPPDSFG